MLDRSTKMDIALYNQKVDLLPHNLGLKCTHNRYRQHHIMETPHYDDYNE